MNSIRKITFFALFIVCYITICVGQTFKSNYSTDFTNAVKKISSQNSTDLAGKISENSKNIIDKSSNIWFDNNKVITKSNIEKIIGSENYKIINSGKANANVITTLYEDISADTYLAIALKDKSISKAYSKVFNSHLRTDIKFLRYLSYHADVFYNVSPKLMSKYGCGNELLVTDTKQKTTTIIDASTKKILGTIDDKTSTIYVDALYDKLLNLGLMSNMIYCDKDANTTYITDKYGRCISIEKKYPANNHKIKPLKQTKLTKNYFMVKKALLYRDSNDTWLNVVALNLGGSVNGVNVDLVNPSVVKEIKKFEKDVEKLLNDSKYAKKQITYTVKREYEEPSKGLLSYRPKAYTYSVSVDGKVVKEKQFINVVN